MHSGRFYGPLKNIGKRTSITSDTTVDGIVVCRQNMKTTFHVPVLKYMIYFMVITEISTIRQISLGAMKKCVCFVRTGVLKVTTVAMNNSTLKSPVYSSHNRIQGWSLM